MSVKVPNDVGKRIKALVFTRAEEFGYGSRSRSENSTFLNSLVEDEQIGGTLRNYMDAIAVRTYIKDGILNAYAKAEVRKKLKQVSLDSVIRKIYGIDAQPVGKIGSTHIYRSATNEIYLIQSGTYLKWETALRKILECVASNDQIESRAVSVNLCLLLAVSCGEMSFGDQKQLERALAYIGVKVCFAK